MAGALLCLVMIQYIITHTKKGYFIVIEAIIRHSMPVNQPSILSVKKRTIPLKHIMKVPVNSLRPSDAYMRQ